MGLFVRSGLLSLAKWRFKHQSETWFTGLVPFDLPS